MNVAARHQCSQPLPGQTLVLFALMSLLLLAGLGLIFDAGLDYSNRRIMQNAADTAALRGARVIAQRAASGGNASVYEEIVETAVINGVPDTTDDEGNPLILCDFLNDNLQVPASLPEYDWGTCHNGPVPANITGVRVRVSETHTPIVMRALGIMTSGTAATAAAQVQTVEQVWDNDFPFMVCGVDTAVAGGPPQDILPTTVKSDIAPGPPPSPMTYPDVATPFGVQDSAYGYDWNDRNADGTFKEINGGTQFIIYGDGFEDCGFRDWKGLANKGNGPLRLPFGDTDVDFAVAIGLEVRTGYINNAIDTSPTRSINGPQGCKATKRAADPFRTNCVMVLPIGNNIPVCPNLCFYSDEESRADGFTQLQVRRWGAFYVVYDEDSEQYWGTLIKNYPMHTDGEIGWTPADYEGPLNITLVQAPVP